MMHTVETMNPQKWLGYTVKNLFIKHTELSDKTGSTGN